MFGYIKPSTPELRLWEYEEYRAVYCGLCRSLGKYTGALSRFTLNYDYVFLAMIRTALLGIKPNFNRGRCIVHPVKNRLFACDDKSLEYCAKISVILSYHKVLDNIADCKGAKKLVALAAKPVVGSFMKNCGQLNEAGEIIAGLLKKMSELEKSSSPTPDMLAEVFGEIMGEVVAFGLDNETNERVAREIGRHTGRYIYVADALDDIERDIKNNEFNPFVTVYGKENISKHREEIKTAVLLELNALEKALQLVDFSSCTGYGNIVNNIIYLGMPKKIDEIIKKTFKDDNTDQKSER